MLRLIDSRLKILHLEDNLSDADLIRETLQLEGIDCEIIRVSSRTEFETALKEHSFDMILSDYSLPNFDGSAALRLAREIDPNIPFILVSGTIGEERAVEFLRNGAVDYVLKDRTPRLVSAVQRAHRESIEQQHRREMEEQLRQRNELFRQITENVDDLVAVVNSQGMAVFTSSSYLTLVGPGTDSKPFFRNIFAEDLNRVTACFDEVLATTNPKRLGYRVSDLVGRVRHLESQWSAIRDHEHQITSVVIVSRDVTEREKAAQTIRDQAELLNQARDGIFVRDMEERITYWNRGAERIYGWTAGEVLGKRVSEFLYKEVAPQNDDIWKSMLEKGEWQGEFIQLTKDGKEISVANRRTLLRNINGEPAAVLSINTDITEKKSLETQVLRSQRLDSIGSLASGIAHDLNNVLAPILMATELVMDHLNDDESRRVLDVAKASAQRGADLVKQVLKFARGSKNESTIVNVVSLIKELERFAKNIFPRFIQIQTVINDGEISVLGDSTQIHQILLNLCVNARDAMPNGGTLVIEARRLTLAEHVFSGQSKAVSGDFVEVAVRDTGTGIPAEVLSRIFDPFYSTKAPERGTGLGLSTVATIVQNHRGFVEVETTVGRGATFRVYLPFASAQPIESSPAIASMPTGNGQWLLLVDDEMALLQMTKELLEAHGYNVLTAKNGSEALVQFGAHHTKIRAVITDLLMPGLNGQQLISTIRAIAPTVIAICVSGSTEESVFRSDKTGAIAFLRKPCSTNDLLATLARLLT